MTTTKKPKLEATVATVKAAAGPTWFDCSDEGTDIEMSTRDHGDVSEEQAGKVDCVEGRRLLIQLRKTFKPAKWLTSFEVVDEWVHVNVRKLPLTKAEKDKSKAKADMAALRERVKAAVDAAQLTVTKANAGQTFSGGVYDGSYYYEVYLSAVFGERILYHGHLGSQYAFATEAEADAALIPLVLQFQDLSMQRSVEAPRENLTYNYSPPNNVIERRGAVTYAVRINY